MSVVLAGSGIAFGTPDGRVLAQGVDFSLEAGQILVVKGPNGVGKTTFLRLLLGFHPCLSGKLTRNVTCKEIGYLPQLQNLGFHLPVTLGDVLAIAAGASKDKVQSIGLMDRAHLDLPWNSASGGERKRALITRVLQAGPRALVLDEPFNHLDRETKKSVTQSLLDFVKVQRGAIAMVSHERDEIGLRSTDVAVVELELGMS